MQSDIRMAHVLNFLLRPASTLLPSILQVYMTPCILSMHICMFQSACGPCSPEELLHTVLRKVIYSHGWLINLFVRVSPLVPENVCP